MTTEKEIRVQAEQQAKEYMQKVKQQNQDKELSDDDLEKVAGGFSYDELVDMYLKCALDMITNDLRNHSDSWSTISFEEWMQTNGYSIS